MTKPRRAGVVARTVTAVHRRAFGLPAGGRPYTVERGLRVRMADGAELVTDVYAPAGEAHGTILIRSPYGRGLPESLFHGRAFADHGYQVIVQSVRGTGGSTGTFRPMTQEASDAQDTVGWLREQSWFTGRLATLGGSYLGWTQWTLLRDPPPELLASVVVAGPHDFARALRGTGSLALADFLGWSAAIRAQGQGGLSEIIAARRRVTAALRERTPAAAATAALGSEETWFAEWLAHPGLDDPFWTHYDATPALTATRVPTLLIGGWHDVFLDQTLEQFQVLTDRGVDVAMTIGPWTHLDTTLKAARVADSEALSWLDQHLAAGPVREDPVRVHVTGADTWRPMPSWPPKTGEQSLGLHADGKLIEEPRKASGTVEFGYDPADPTPSLGGRHMSAKAGRQDNRPLERRDDVITFTTEPLTAPVHVFGSPHLDLQLTVATTARPDLFVRLCDVDDRGRSRNVTETFVRLTTGSGRASLPLGACAHEFRTGHRIRLQISGGAYPRFARNEAPCRYTVLCEDSRLTLPVEPSAVITPRPQWTAGVRRRLRDHGLPT